MRKKSKTEDKDKDSFFSLSANYEGICNSYEASTERGERE